MDANLRHRANFKETFDKSTKSSFNKEHKTSYKSYNLLREYAWFAIFVYYMFVLLLIHERSASLPDVTTSQSDSDAQREHQPPHKISNSLFSEERARRDLIAISSKWPRLVGSQNNEVFTVDYLLEIINKIKEDSSNDLYTFEIDVQRVSGNFSLSFLGELTSIYANVNNIVVKITPKDRATKDYLLINSHYDAAIGSPGK